MSEHDFVGDLLAYDDVLRARVETLAVLASRETMLRENAEFYKHKAVRATGQPTEKATDDPDEASLTEFETAKDEMSSIFRKLRRRLASTQDASTADERDGMNLSFTISNLSSLLRGGSAASSRTLTDSREKASGLEADFADTGADLVQLATSAETNLKERRENLLVRIASDCESVAELASRDFKDRLRVSKGRTASLCGCGDCLARWLKTVRASVEAEGLPSSALCRSETGRSPLSQQLAACLTYNRQLERERVDVVARVRQLKLRLASVRARAACRRWHRAMPQSRDTASFDHGVCDSLLRFRDAAVAQCAAEAIADSIRDSTHRALLAFEITNDASCTI